MTAEHGSRASGNRRIEINDHPPKKFGDRTRLIAIEMEGAFGNEGALPLFVARTRISRIADRPIAPEWLIFLHPLIVANEHNFTYDVFLSHSAKDKAVVRDVAERLRKDGVKVWFDEWVLKPGDSIPAKIEEGLKRSRVLVLCMSANAFGSDWAQLESGTFSFRDPLNKERRFIPLRLDDAPIKGFLAQFLYINWLPDNREQEYARLLEACGPPKMSPAGIDSQRQSVADSIVGSGTPLLVKNAPDVVFLNACRSSTKSSTEGELPPLQSADLVIDVPSKSKKYGWAFTPNGDRVFSCSYDKTVRLWELKNGRSLRVFKGHTAGVYCVALSNDERRILTGSSDNTVRLWDTESGRCLLVFEGHTQTVMSVAWSNDDQYAISGSHDKDVRVWDVQTGKCVSVLIGHDGVVWAVGWVPSQKRVLSGSSDSTIRLWDIETGRCLRILEGHKGSVWSVAASGNTSRALTGSDDHTVKIWDLETGWCLRTLEGHRQTVTSVAWSSDERFGLSGSEDGTARLWDSETGSCLRVLQGSPAKVVTVAWGSDTHFVFSGDNKQGVRAWNLLEFREKARVPKQEPPGFTIIHYAGHSRFAPDQVQYTNAKVLLVGDTNAGKTGLTHRLATGEWKPSGASTVGAWSTQWQLKEASAEPGLDRELWLWDFGGQADQRLIHQLYMDRTALILLLFNADQEDVLPGLRDWQTALRRCVKEKIPYFLVAGRIDTGFKASRGKLQAFAKEQGLAYHETSAKSGDGCHELRAAMIAGIPWAQMEKRTSPRIFKLIKDEILKLRDEGQVLHTFKELRELLWRRLPHEPRFTDETLQTVIGLLDGPGVVKELDYGTYILLAPEWINAYAQAVIRTLRSAENDLGVLPLRSIAEGRLIYQSIGRDGVPVEMKRLPPAEERVVLGEMERQLEQRGLCLRQGDKLVFPSHCGRDRPAVLEHPSVFVSYAVKGFLDDIYATLVVKLADSESFQLKELWRDAADFVTLAGDHHMGIKLTRASGSDGDVSVYFGKGVKEGEQVIFANYIHRHLMAHCEAAQRLRYFVCPHCHTAKGNPQVLMDKLVAKGQYADTECDRCGMRYLLWDALEQKFAHPEFDTEAAILDDRDSSRLDSRRKGKLLALEVGSRITSADQKCFEIPATEDEGIDMELEFTNDEGKGTGKRLYLQLKSGNSHLKTLKDGTEIFAIREQRWVEYWLAQPHPVMLVIGTFHEEDERSVGKEKLEFADVRWMEITSALKRESQNGAKPVKQIEFKGERLDLSSVRRWRDRIL